LYATEKEYQIPYCKANAVIEGEGLKVWLKISIFGSMYSTVQYSKVCTVHKVGGFHDWKNAEWIVIRKPRPK
jgi:hypothetical protein